MTIFDYYENDSAAHWTRLLGQEKDVWTLLELSAQLLELDDADLQNSEDVRRALVGAIWRVLDDPDTADHPEPDPNVALETAMDKPVVVMVFDNAHYGVLLKDPRFHLDDKRSPLLRVRDASDVPSLKQDSGYVSTWEPYPTSGWPGDLANVVPFDDLDEPAQSEILEQVEIATTEFPKFIAGLQKMIIENGDNHEDL